MKTRTKTKQRKRELKAKEIKRDLRDDFTLLLGNEIIDEMAMIDYLIEADGL